MGVDQQSEQMQEWHFVAASEAATLRCAAWLAALAQTGWVIALDGDLGAGKTSFARGFIQAKCGPSTIVPSPSFTLVQPYESCTPPLLHSDFYRLSDPQEIDELGVLEALDSHCLLVEWAERAQGVLPAPSVRVALRDDGDDPQARHITISAAGDILSALKAASARDTALTAFLKQAGWGSASRAALAGDASTRRYERLSLDGHKAVLMDWAKGPDGPPLYDNKPYSAVAHLAEAMPAYCRMVDWLDAHALAAPRLLARDEAAGFALMEDFGDRHLANEANLDRAVFYAEAVANLVHLHALAPAAFLSAYDGAVQAVEASLFLDWFLPWRGIDISAAARQTFLTFWHETGNALAQGDRVCVLRDYHSVNLLWREQGQGRFRVGLIDVQDALAGHAAYDLASLLCDARIDVDGSLGAQCYETYCATRFGADDKARDAFAAAYALCAVQRNLKIAGIFIRLAKRDNKPGYLKHLPRILGYIKSHLAHPALAPMATWLQTHAPHALEMADE